MSKLQFRKAERFKRPLRLGMSWISGTGKTWSSLLIAHGITKDWSKICVIDTENSSSELYTRLGEFNIIELEPPFTPDRFIEAISLAESNGQEIIIIDSFSHEWKGKGGILSMADAEKAKKKNGLNVWLIPKAKHEDVKEKIKYSTSGIIVCMREKSEHVQGTNEKTWKGFIEKVGTKAITEEDYDYEMDIFFTLKREGETRFAIADKDRSGLFNLGEAFTVTEQTGEIMKEWIETGNNKEEVMQAIEDKAEEDREAIRLEEEAKLEAIRKEKEEAQKKIDEKLETSFGVYKDSLEVCTTLDELRLTYEVIFEEKKKGSFTIQRFKDLVVIKDKKKAEIENPPKKEEKAEVPVMKMTEEAQEAEIGAEIESREAEAEAEAEMQAKAEDKERSRKEGE